jgi:hypothetical protein
VALLRRSRAQRLINRLPSLLMSHDDEDFVGAALQGLSRAATVEAPDMEPMHAVVSDGLSSSKGDGAGVGAASASCSEEVSTRRRSQSSKTPGLEESEAESEEHPPPT